MEVVYLIGDLDLEGEGAFEEQAEGPRNPEQEGEYGAINSKEIIAIVACVVIVAPTLPHDLPPLYHTASSTPPPPPTYSTIPPPLPHRLLNSCTTLPPPRTYSMTPPPTSSLLLTQRHLLLLPRPTPPLTSS